MEERTKRIWLVVGIIAVLGACCVAATVTAFGGMMALRSRDWSDLDWDLGGEESRARIERSFSVGRSPSVEVDNFAGSVTVSRGESGTVEVIAVKRARGMSAANVRVEMRQEGDRVVIETEGRPGLRSASVSIEIDVPEDTELDLHTGAGEVSVSGLSADVTLHSNAGAINVYDVKGSVDASTNAGKVEVRDAAGPVRLRSNAGSVEYEGDPQGECDLRSNAGAVKLQLPADLNAYVELSSNAGSVSLEHSLSQSKSSSRQRIAGTVGDGSDARITAHTNAGSVSVRVR
jgi:hypothetical protein